MNVSHAAFALMLIFVVEAIDWTKPCKEGQQWKDSCHTCHCSNGRPSCTRELCPDEANTAQMPTTLNAANPPTDKTSSGATMHSGWLFAVGLTLAVMACK